MRGIACPWWLRVAVVSCLSLGVLSPFESRSVPAVAQAAPGVELPGKIRGPAYALAAQGTRVYLGVGTRLVVLDIADPTAPRVDGHSEPLPALVRSLAVHGEYAYVLADHVRIFNVSNPSQIIQVASYAPPDSRFFEALTLGEPEVRPTRPGLVGGRNGARRSLGTSSTSHGEQSGLDRPSRDTNLAPPFSVDGRYLYVAGLGGLRIVDVSHPSNPTEVSSQATEGVHDREVTVVGSHAFVAGRYGVYPQEQGYVRIVDVSDPQSPKQVGFYNSLFDAYPPGIAVDGQHAFITLAGWGWSGQAGDLRILDVSDLASLKPVASASIGPSRHITVSGTFAYVTAYNYFSVVDVREPNYPVQVARQRITRDPRGLVVQEGYAYVLDEAGLRVINVFDPFLPVQVGSMRTASSGQ
jgi:hypothetical protein